jgi:foldase protein PrsA
MELPPRSNSHPLSALVASGCRTARCPGASRALLAIACGLFAGAALTACGSSSTRPASIAQAGRKTASAPGSTGKSPGAAGETPSEAALSAVSGQLPGSTAGAGSQQVVARVQNQPITLGELHHLMGSMGPSKQEVPQPPDFTRCVAQRATSAQGRSPAELVRDCKSRYEELKRTALNLLIHARWISLEARQAGIRSDESALDREIAQGLKSAAEAGQTLESTGRTISDVKYWQRLNQYSTALFHRAELHTPKVSEQRIADFYAQNKESFASPESRDLHLIRSDTATSAQRVLRAIRSGRSFQSVARELATHQPIHTDEGSIEGLTYADYSEPRLSNAIFRAHPHQLEGPIELEASNIPKIALGYYVFEVTRIHPARREGFAQARASIAARLPGILHELQLKADVAAFKRKWRARSDCRVGYVVEDCRQYAHKPRFEDPYTF